MANPKPSPCVENSHNPNNSGIYGDWPCYEGIGTTASDVSGNGNNATLGGGATWATGAYGPAVSAASGSYLAVSFPAVPTNTAFTMILGFEPTTYPGGFTVILDDSARVWSSFFGTGGAQTFPGNYLGNPPSGFPAMSPGSPWRWVLTRAANDVNINWYLNGIFYGQSSSLGPSSIPAATVFFGFNVSGGGANLTGLCDGLKFYLGTALSPTQILQDAADGFACYRVITPIQSTPLGHSTASTTAVCAFGTTPTTGDTFEVSVWGKLSSATIAAPTIADNQTGNTYLPAVFKDDTLLNGEFCGIWYLPATAVISGTCSITVTAAIPCLALEIQATELNPSLTADQSSSSVGTGTAPSPGVVTTTANDEIIFTVCSANDTIGVAVAPPSGFYLSGVELSSGTYQTGGTAYQSVSSIQTATNPAFSLNTSSVWADVLATFKVSSPPPPPTGVVIWELKPNAYNPGDTWLITPHNFP